MRRWRLAPNPSKVLDFHTSDPLSWPYITSRLVDAGIDPRLLDGPRYEALRGCATDHALSAALLELRDHQASGLLGRRYRNWSNHGDAIIRDTLQTETEKKFPVGLNNTRFSHRFPRGVECTDPRIALLTVDAEEASSGAVPPQKYHHHHRHLFSARRDRPPPSAAAAAAAALAGPMSCWDKIRRRLRRRFKYPAWRYILFVVLVGVPLMAGAVYLMAKTACRDGEGEGCGWHG